MRLSASHSPDSPTHPPIAARYRRSTTPPAAGQPGTSILLAPPAADPGISEDERHTIIERAAALLRRGDLSVTEVCFEVGCASLGTFTTRFTELVGMSPGVFRRQAADAAAGQAGAAGAAREVGSAIKVEGMPACVAKQVSRPVRNREAPAAAKPLA
ncbi:helix-turn-helix domain-containing protein [Streptomyces sp. CB01881]|uniref:helix-turn-helix domain-containing protein n=1 Tax=Streptomyces sp. CB01881 TaxID=2078691 RepID=UPI001F4F6F1E|nr:helix-turn-helix domain-containing protein [Streptomyces sp. CB01881]